MFMLMGQGSGKTDTPYYCSIKRSFRYLQFYPLATRLSAP